MNVFHCTFLAESKSKKIQTGKHLAKLWKENIIGLFWLTVYMEDTRKRKRTIPSVSNLYLPVWTEGFIYGYEFTFSLMHSDFVGISCCLKCVPFNGRSSYSNFKNIGWKWLQLHWYATVHCTVSTIVNALIWRSNLVFLNKLTSYSDSLIHHHHPAIHGLLHYKYIEWSVLACKDCGKDKFIYMEYNSTENSPSDFSYWL